MQVRCPNCGHIADNLPLTHKCPKCDTSPRSWLIYDWESFALTKHRHIKYNLLIIVATLANLFAAIAIKSTDPHQWLFSLLLIPAMISLVNCRNQLKRKSEYKGHKSRETVPWFAGFGGF